MGTVGMVGIDRIGAASLELELASAAGRLTRSAALISDTLRFVDVCDETSGRLRATVAWIDQAKADLQRRAGLVDVPDGAYGPFVPSMLLLHGPWDEGFIGPVSPAEEAGLGYDDLFGKGLQWSKEGLPYIEDPKIRSILEDLYKPVREGRAPVGSGSTTDALLSEIKTGDKVGKRFHLEKTINDIRGLRGRLADADVPTSSRALAGQAMDELDRALETGAHPDLVNMASKGGHLLEAAEQLGYHAVDAQAGPDAASLLDVLESDGEAVAEGVEQFLEDIGPL